MITIDVLYEPVVYFDVEREEVLTFDVTYEPSVYFYVEN